MKCEDVIQRKELFLAGELAASEKEELHSHLQRCRSCARQIDETQRFLDSVEQYMISLHPREGLQEDLLKAFREMRDRVKPRKRLAHLFPALAVAAVILIGIMVLLLWQPAPQTFEEIPIPWEKFPQEKQTLADGTTLRATPRSIYRIVGYRSLELTGGELWLEVAKNQETPFSIKTPAGDVIVHGTEFVVQVKKAKEEKIKVSGSLVAVLVISGMVELVNPLGKEIAKAGEYLYTRQDSQPQKQIAKQQKPEVKYAKVFFWQGKKGYLYDLNTQKWEETPEVPILPRTGFSTVLWKSKLFIWGGVHGDSFSDGAIYDLIGKRWKIIGIEMYEDDEEMEDDDQDYAAIVGRYGHITHLWKSKVFIWGGESTISGGTWNGGIYNLEKGEWEEINEEAPIEERKYYRSVLVGSKVFIWGGYSAGHGVHGLNDGAIYDIEKDEWKKLPEAPIKGRYNHTVISYGSKVFIWGGTAKDGAIYDIEKGEWERLPKAPIKSRRCYRGYALCGSKVFIWGGVGKKGKILSDGAIYDFEKNGWKLLPEAPIKSGKRPIAYVAGSKILVIRDRDSFIDGAIYDLDKESWERLPGPPIDMAIGVFGCSFMYGSKLFILKSTRFGMNYDVAKGEWKRLPRGPLARRSKIIPLISR
jgi:ferric-dicitrate binding protein FerR (iron transport regulator)